MTARGFSDKHDCSQRSLVAAGNKSGQPHSRKEVRSRVMCDDHGERFSECSACQKERYEHGADSTHSQRSQSGDELKDSEVDQLQRIVRVRQDISHSFVIRTERNQRARICGDEYETAEGRQQTSGGKFYPVRNGASNHERAKAPEGNVKG